MTVAHNDCRFLARLVVSEFDKPGLQPSGLGLRGAFHIFQTPPIPLIGPRRPYQSNIVYMSVRVVRKFLTTS